MRYSISLTLMLIPLLGLLGCATNPEYQKFAKAGMDYANTLPPMFTIGCNAQVDSSSWGLILDLADSPNGKISKSSINAIDDIDEERCDILRLLSKHSILLGSYFAKLNEISTTETGSEIGNEIDHIFEQVQTFGLELRGTGVFRGTPELGQVAQFAVNQRINKALRDELEKRQKTLQEEFYTQEELLKKLGEQIKFAQKEVINRKAQIYIQEPLLDGKPLNPELLITTRRQHIANTFGFAELSAASNTAKKARKAFNDLISGDVDSDTMLARIDALTADIVSLRAAVLTLDNL